MTLNPSLLAHWDRVARAAEQAVDPNDTNGVSAVLAAYSMADTIRCGRRIPIPMPELNAKLARAEELAQAA
jgi:hypothetical protein